MLDNHKTLKLYNQQHEWQNPYLAMLESICQCHENDSSPYPIYIPDADGGIGFPHAPVHARLRNDPTLLDTSILCVCMFPLVEEICLVAVEMDSPDTSPNVNMVVIQHIGLLCNERGLKRFTCISHIKHFPKLKLVCRN